MLGLKFYFNPLFLLLIIRPDPKFVGNSRRQNHLLKFGKVFPALLAADMPLDADVVQFAGFVGHEVPEVEEIPILRPADHIRLVVYEPSVRLEFFFGLDLVFTSHQ